MIQLKNFILRTSTSLIYAGIWIVGLFFSTPLLAVLAVFFATMATFELFDLVEQVSMRPAKRKMMFFVILWWALWLFWFLTKDFTRDFKTLFLQSIFFVFLSWILIMFIMLIVDTFSKKQKDVLSMVGFITMVFWYIFYPLQGLVFFSAIEHAVFYNRLLLILFVVWSFDTFAYLIGSISPEKTFIDTVCITT